MKIAVIQTVVPDYRLGLFRILKKHYGDELVILSGQNDFSTNKTSEQADTFLNRINNIFLLNKRFLWQCLPWRMILSADIVILNGNMRIISSTLAVAIRRIFALPTLNWNHLQGKRNIPTFLRSIYLWFFDGFITYTETETQEAVRLFRNIKVFAAPNACLYKRECYSFQCGIDEVNDIIYVGRLIPEKKPMLLVKAFMLAKNRNILPATARLVIIGDGPEKEKIYIYLKENFNETDAVLFLGRISNVNVLREHYRTALVSVSPGYVGLSATQSFAFGVPMLISKNEPHSPEIEACIEGETAYFFDSDNAEALAEKLNYVFSIKDEIVLRRIHISEATKDKYSFETMANRFIQAIGNYLE